MRDQPNPGSVEARALGCTCPVIDNGHGKGAYADENGDPLWWYDMKCPVHVTNSAVMPKDPATIRHVRSAEMIATQWERQTFRVLTNDVMRNARTQMTGYVHATAPGLAITRSIVSEGFWTITHVRSGTAVLKMFESMADALVSLRSIAGLCDWTLSAEQIDNLPNRDAVARALNAELQRYTDFYRLKVGPVSPEALCDVQPRAAREG